MHQTRMTKLKEGVSSVEGTCKVVIIMAGLLKASEKVVKLIYCR